MDAQIAQLQRLRSGLTECIGCGCLSLATCAVLNPRDALAERGAGPRAWIDDLDGADDDPVRP